MVSTVVLMTSLLRASHQDDEQQALSHPFPCESLGTRLTGMPMDCVMRKQRLVTSYWIATVRLVSYVGY